LLAASVFSVGLARSLNELLPVAKEYGEPSDTIIGVTIGMIIMAISLIMMYA
jgi:ZIP family zinc transporter